MNPRLAVIALVLVASSWTSAGPPIEAAETERLEVGVTTWPQIERWWGAGRLVGRSGPWCGAIRSLHPVAHGREIELSWQGGVVCGWRIRPGRPGPALRAVRSD